jgi:hypothetical protein
MRKPRFAAAVTADLGRHRIQGSSYLITHGRRQIHVRGSIDIDRAGVDGGGGGMQIGRKEQ